MWIGNEINGGHLYRDGQSFDSMANRLNFKSKMNKLLHVIRFLVIKLFHIFDLPIVLHGAKILTLTKAFGITLRNGLTNQRIRQQPQSGGKQDILQEELMMRPPTTRPVERERERDYQRD